MDKKFHQMTDEEQYDNLVDRLMAMNVEIDGLPKDMYIVLTRSWEPLKWNRRALISITHELTTLMEWQQQSEMEASLND